jgi:hypothetical protein
VVLSVDENVASATGCSIDKSVHFFQQLGTELNIDYEVKLSASFPTYLFSFLLGLGGFGLSRME